MSAESEVHDALNAYPALTAMIDTRIYPDFLAQEISLPAVVYQRAETEYITTVHDGLVHGSRVTMEVWCMHVTRIGAEQLADLVEQAMAGGLLPVDRRPEFDPASATFSTVVSCVLWPE